MTSQPHSHTCPRCSAEGGHGSSETALSGLGTGIRLDLKPLETADEAPDKPLGINCRAHAIIHKTLRGIGAPSCSACVALEPTSAVQCIGTGCCAEAHLRQAPGCTARWPYLRTWHRLKYCRRYDARHAVKIPERTIDLVYPLQCRLALGLSKQRSYRICSSLTEPSSILLFLMRSLRLCGYRFVWFSSCLRGSSAVLGIE